MKSHEILDRFGIGSGPSFFEDNSKLRGGLYDVFEPNSGNGKQKPSANKSKDSVSWGSGSGSGV